MGVEQCRTCCACGRRPSCNITTHTPPSHRHTLQFLLPRLGSWVGRLWFKHRFPPQLFCVTCPSHSGDLAQPCANFMAPAATRYLAQDPAPTYPLGCGVLRRLRAILWTVAFSGASYTHTAIERLVNLTSGSSTCAAAGYTPQRLPYRQRVCGPPSHRATTALISFSVHVAILLRGATAQPQFAASRYCLALPHTRLRGVLLFIGSSPFYVLEQPPALLYFFGLGGWVQPGPQFPPCLHCSITPRTHARPRLTRHRLRLPVPAPTAHARTHLHHTYYLPTFAPPPTLPAYAGRTQHLDNRRTGYVRGG